MTNIEILATRVNAFAVAAISADAAGRPEIAAKLRAWQARVYDEMAEAQSPAVPTPVETEAE